MRVIGRRSERNGVSDHCVYSVPHHNRSGLSEWGTSQVRRSSWITAHTSFTRFSPCQGENPSKVRIDHNPTGTGKTRPIYSLRAHPVYPYLILHQSSTRFEQDGPDEEACHCDCIWLDDFSRMSLATTRLENGASRHHGRA